MAVLENLGDRAGRIFAPFLSLGSHLRHARVFHPAGIVFEAAVEAISSRHPFAKVGERLAGPALVRFSAGVWRHKEHFPDVLGVAIRFGADFRHPERVPDASQDLLFGTFKSVATLFPALLTTKTSDYLANEYYTVTHYQTPGIEDFECRLVPLTPRRHGSSRDERLEKAVEDGQANFRFEVRQGDPQGSWVSVASMRLLRRSDVDQARLGFSPFHQGRHLKPIGFVNHLRRIPYRESRAARKSFRAVQAKES